MAGIAPARVTGTCNRTLNWKGHRMKRLRLSALLLSAALLATACGDDGGDTGTGEEGLSLDQVRLAIDNDDFMNQMAWMIADDQYWPDLGFTEPAEVVASDEYIAGLVGGDVWVAQGESDVIWSALGEGSVPLTIIGVEKDVEAWFLGIREGVDPMHSRVSRSAAARPVTAT